MRFPASSILDTHALLDPEGLKKAVVEPSRHGIASQGLPSPKARANIEEELEAGPSHQSRRSQDGAREMLSL